MLNIMDDKMINRVFVIGITVLFALAFLQLSLTGHPFAGMSCLLVATVVVFIARAEERRK
jgi:uncharacterized protein (DUF486 family)